MGKTRGKYMCRTTRTRGGEKIQSVSVCFAGTEDRNSVFSTHGKIQMWLYAPVSPALACWLGRGRRTLGLAGHLV